MGGRWWWMVVIKDTAHFIQIEGLYSLFSAVERFLNLSDFLNYFGSINFFSLCLRDFLN